MASKRGPRTAKRKTVGARIIASLKEAVAGTIARVTIDGQMWERINPPLKKEQRIRKIMNRCTEARTFTDANGETQYIVRLKIDHQSFTIEGIHDKHHANFYRRALAQALNRFKYED